jgi:hypothetical protein
MNLKHIIEPSFSKRYQANFASNFFPLFFLQKCIAVAPQDQGHLLQEAIWRLVYQCTHSVRVPIIPYCIERCKDAKTKCTSVHFVRCIPETSLVLSQTRAFKPMNYKNFWFVRFG